MGLSLVLNGPSQGKWVYRDTPAQNERAFIVDNDSDALFERRGVIAIGGGMPTRALVDHIAPYEERAISIFKAMNVSGAPAIWEMS